MERPNYKEYLILDALEDYINKKGESPTLEELCSMTGILATSTIYKYLKSLQKKGYVEVKPRTRRGISLIK